MDAFVFLIVIIIGLFIFRRILKGGGVRYTISTDMAERHTFTNYLEINPTPVGGDIFLSDTNKDKIKKLTVCLGIKNVHRFKTTPIPEQSLILLFKSTQSETTLSLIGVKDIRLFAEVLYHTVNLTEPVTLKCSMQLRVKSKDKGNIPKVVIETMVVNYTTDQLIIKLGLLDFKIILLIDSAKLQQLSSTILNSSILNQ